MPWPSSVLHKAHSGDNSRAGFGLIELMVSISIMVIVAGIILARQDSFNGAVLLRGQAYEIAFAIREVQLNAVSASNSTGGDAFRSPLGVNFTTSAGLNNQFVSFQDINNNYAYDSGDIDIGQPSVIDSRFYISAIEMVGGASPTDASVLFERPNFDANFSETGSAMRIHIRRVGSNPSTDMGPGDLRIVEITSTGQIDII